MAAKKKPKGSAKRGASRKRPAGVKRGSRSSDLAATRNGNYLLSSDTGHVYVLSKSGGKRIRRHVAKKAAAHEITRTMGLSSHQLSNARSLLARLERQGRIEKL